MAWLLRPSVLVVVSVVLSLGAAALVLGPWWQGGSAQATPRPLAPGDQEIVWLNAATSAVAWERFVTALRQAWEEHADVWQLDDAGAFPAQTTAVPEVALTWKRRKARLWFRWYKLTGEQKSEDWVEALVRRTPPPLAIVGGGNSDRARDLAVALRAAGTTAPLLLITTATADHVPAQNDPSSWVRLDEIHAGRTFRFCFTNRQMARAVIDFLWGQDDLRPLAEPVYLPAWSDDPYSLDLADGYHEALGADRQRRQAALDAAQAWAGAVGTTAGAGPFTGINAPPARPTVEPFLRYTIAHSVGGYDNPNRPESDAAERLMMDRRSRERPGRSLLVLPATVQPARRFLRGLMRAAPTEARRFVVAGGDTPDFNTVYRDRGLAWPIQDLPFDLVFFCHRDPTTDKAPAGHSFGGQEDLRLYADIVAAVLDAAADGTGLVQSTDELAANLRVGRSVRFDASGNRPAGGEYVVCLRPHRSGDRIEPRATLQVYRTERGRPRGWELVREVVLDYTPPWPAEGPTP